MSAKQVKPNTKSRAYMERIALLLAVLILGLSMGAAGLSAAKAIQEQSIPEDVWTPLTQPTVPGGTVIDLAISPTVSDTLYSLLESQDGPRLFRSLNAAQTWQARYTFTQTMLSLAVDPLISTTVYMGGESGLYRSPDSGLSWTQVYTLGQVFAVVSPTLMYAGGQIAPPSPPDCFFGELGVARSQNGGLTWVVSSLGCQGELMVIAVDPSDSATLYVGGGLDWKIPTLWRSADGGITWDFLADDLWPNSPIQSLLVDPLTSERLYISNNSGIYTSPDEGQTWHWVEGLPYGPFQLAVSGGDLYAAPYWDEIHIYRSEDGGESWWVSLAELPEGVTDLKTDLQRPERIFAGLLHYGVWRSDWRGSNWVEANRGIESPVWVNALAARPDAPQQLYAGSDYPRSGLFQSDDGGLSWTTVLTDTPIRSIAVHPITPTIAYAAGANGVYRVPNGESWDHFWSRVRATDLAFSHHPEPWLFVSGYCEDRQQGCVLSYGPTPGQVDWAWVTAYITNSMEIRSIATDPFDPLCIYAGGEYKTKLSAVWRSQDGGNSWQETSSTRFLNLADIQVDPLRTGWVYLSAFDGMYLSRDGGQTWDRYVAGFFPTSDTMTSLAQDEMGFIYAGSYDGAFSWDPIDFLWTPAGLQGEMLDTLIHLPGNTPALLAGGRSGLWRQDLPLVQRVWLPTIYR